MERVCAISLRLSRLSIPPETHTATSRWHDATVYRLFTVIEQRCWPRGWLALTPSQSERAKEKERETEIESTATCSLSDDLCCLHFLQVTIGPCPAYEFINRVCVYVCVCVCVFVTCWSASTILRSGKCTIHYLCCWEPLDVRENRKFSFFRHTRRTPAAQLSSCTRWTLLFSTPRSQHR